MSVNEGGLVDDELRRSVIEATLQGRAPSVPREAAVQYRQQPERVVNEYAKNEGCPLCGGQAESQRGGFVTCAKCASTIRERYWSGTVRPVESAASVTGKAAESPMEALREALQHRSTVLNDAGDRSRDEQEDIDAMRRRFNS